MGGYTGGLERKELLLTLEQRRSSSCGEGFPHVGALVPDLPVGEAQRRRAERDGVGVITPAVGALLHRRPVEAPPSVSTTRPSSGK